MCGAYFVVLCVWSVYVCSCMYSLFGVCVCVCVVCDSMVASVCSGVCVYMWLCTSGVHL